jgi:phosphate-selective porin
MCNSHIRCVHVGFAAVLRALMLRCKQRLRKTHVGCCEKRQKPMARFLQIVLHDKLRPGRPDANKIGNLREPSVHQPERYLKKTALAGAVLLSLSSGAAHAQSAAQQKKEIEELRRQMQQLTRQIQSQPRVDAKEVEALRKQVDELKAQVNAQQPAVAVAAAPGGDVDDATRDAATSATKSDIQGIRTDFENYKYEQARIGERNRASVTRNTKIAGTIQTRATWQNPSQNAGVANGATGGNTSFQATDRSSSFDIPSVTLNMTGNLYRDYQEGRNLTYALGFSYASNSAGNPSSTTSAARTLGVSAPNGSQFNLTNAFLAYSFFPTNGGQEDSRGSLTFGQQLVPFGLEAQADEEVRPVINSAQFTSALSGINNRQIGLIYRGDSFVDVDWTNNYRSALLEYAFGVVNGSGPNKSDNNGTKDWLGRLAVTVPSDYNSWLRQLKFGVSYYLGYNNLVNPTSNAVVRIGKAERKGFDLNWTHLPYSIAYEFAQGDDDTFTTAASSATTATPTFRKKPRGQYINFGYTWGEQFLASEKTLAKYDDYWPKSYQAFVRYDTFDADTRTNVSGDETNILTLGLNAFFAETTKLQFNYLITRNDMPATGFTADRPRKSNAVQVQFQYGF